MATPVAVVMPAPTRSAMLRRTLAEYRARTHSPLRRTLAEYRARTHSLSFFTCASSVLRRRHPHAMRGVDAPRRVPTHREAVTSWQHCRIITWPDPRWLQGNRRSRQCIPLRSPRRSRAVLPARSRPSRRSRRAGGTPGRRTATPAHVLGARQSPSRWCARPRPKSRRRAAARLKSSNSERNCVSASHPNTAALFGIHLEIPNQDARATLSRLIRGVAAGPGAKGRAP